MSHSRAYDVVLFGATGFTGKLTAAYLARKAAREPFRWAIAGRNRAKLEEVRQSLASIDPACAKLDLVEASADDPASLASMAQSARVVLTTVGPYVKHGEPVVAACVAAGADYVDITGEPEFVDMTIAKYDDAARAKGIRIVSCCGFDSIPHDLGALYTVKRMPRDVPLRIRGFVRAHGTFSGGTWQSAIAAMARLGKTARAQKPHGESNGRRVRGAGGGVRYERELGAWACPLPTIDPQIVLRSARALDEYGPSFEYGHYAQIKSTATLAAGVVGVGALVALAQIPPARMLLEKVRVSGDGPGEEERARGWFQVTFLADAGDVKVRTRVSGGDPGYTETSKMVAEAALCLALDRAKLPARSGVLTPAAAMGEPLIDRLVREGIRFEVIEG